jgi:hypothetical protein
VVRAALHRDGVFDEANEEDVSIYISVYVASRPKVEHLKMVFSVETSTDESGNRGAATPPCSDGQRKENGSSDDIDGYPSPGC